MNKNLPGNLVLLSTITTIVGIALKFGLASALIAIGVVMIWYAVGLRFSARQKAAIERQEQMMRQRADLHETFSRRYHQN